MKKSKKMLLRVMPILMVLMIVVLSGNVFGIAVASPSAGTQSSTVSGLTSRVWGTISAVIQVVAIAAIVLAGVRYMFASADAKADIKKQTIILLVGAVLVFLAVPITQLIVNAASDIVAQP